MTLPAVEAALAKAGLGVLGGFRPLPGDGVPERAAVLLLVGPAGSGFWPVFAASDEARDGAPDPLDRWTRRVLGGLAYRFGANVLFPFGGPPWHPFIRWAERTGRIWASPVGLLVHDRLGLWVSFRGALAFPEPLELPAPGARPCEGCSAPCSAACPVGALTPAGYDVAGCRDWIGRPGADCSGLGCGVRRACPVGRDLVPPAERRAFHMRAFHGRQGG